MERFETPVATVGVSKQVRALCTYSKLRDKPAVWPVLC